jgi:hypothetical protein
MVTLYANSVNTILYYPTVDEVVTELTNPPVVTVVGEAGNVIELSTSPVWDETNQCYILFTEPNDITVAYVGQIWTFTWTWVWDNQQFSESERAVVVENSLGEMTSMLRRKLRDNGEIHQDFYRGDGITSSFELSGTNLKRGSELITNNSGIVSSTVYTLDYFTGLLTFYDTPMEGDVIRVSYLNYIFSDLELDSYARQGVINLNMACAIDRPMDVGEMTDCELQIAVLFAVYEVYTDEMMNGASTNFSWREGEKAIDKSRITTSYKDSIALLKVKLDSLVRSYVSNNTTGGAYSGGIASIRTDAIDWELINATNTIPAGPRFNPYRTG